MKKLDDIFLEDIKSFEILDKTLIIHTKDEVFEYNYPNDLELLRRISYFMHRYRVESGIKINNSMQRLDNESQNIKRNIINSCDVFFNNCFKSTLILVFISLILGFNLAMLGIYFGFGLYNFAKLVSEIKKENSKFSIEKIFKNNTFMELQNMQSAFSSLKNQSLDFIVSLDSKLLDNIKSDIDPEKTFIENITSIQDNIATFLEEIPYIYEEKSFQKSLGTHPKLKN